MAARIFQSRRAEGGGVSAHRDKLMAKFCRNSSQIDPRSVRAHTHTQIIASTRYGVVDISFGGLAPLLSSPLLSTPIPRPPGSDGGIKDAD